MNKMFLFLAKSDCGRIQSTGAQLTYATIGKLERVVDQI